MKSSDIKSVFTLEGKELQAFLDKYGDIFEPRLVDFEYYKLYYLGKYDHHRLIFNYIREMYNIDRVFYPGSFVHITPSFTFPNVTYADTHAGLTHFFNSEDVVKYIELHKIYQEPTIMSFVNDSYITVTDAFDLMISSNAGSVSIDCKHCLKHGGLLLVNNGHSDADNAFADNDYEYIGYFKYDYKKEHVNFILDGTSTRSNTFYLFKRN